MAPMTTTKSEQRAGRSNQWVESGPPESYRSRCRTSAISTATRRCINDECDLRIMPGTPPPITVFEIGFPDQSAEHHRDSRMVE